MLKHTINLAMSALLIMFATPAAAGQSVRADTCGYVCIFADGK